MVSHFFFLSDCEDEEELLMSVSPTTTTPLGTRCWHYKLRDDPKDRGSTYRPTLGTRHGAQEALPVMGMHSPTTAPQTVAIKHSSLRLSHPQALTTSLWNSGEASLYRRGSPWKPSFYLSSVLSCTSSTMMWVTPCRVASPSSLLSSTPVVQYSSLVAEDWHRREQCHTLARFRKRNYWQAKLNEYEWTLEPPAISFNMR